MRRPILLAATLAVLACPLTVRAGVVVEYLFDGNANDTSGNGEHGVLVGDATFATGVYGEALSLDGSGDYVDVAISDYTYTNFTLECWIKVPTYDDNVHYISLQDNSYLVLGDYGQGPFSTWADGLDPIDIDNDLGVEPDLTTDEWHHVAFTYDGSYQRLFHDGVEVGTVSTTGSVTHSASYYAGLNIGSRHTGGTQYVDGLIDNVRIWDEALDVLDLGYYQDGQTCDDADLDGYDDVACGGDDCDDADPGINPGATEILDAVDDDCDGYVDEGLLAAGDLIVTEIMKDPSAVNDEYGEWFEVYNASNVDINLYGATVYDLGGDSFTVGSDLWVTAGEHAVLARNGDDGVNGGVIEDYEYGAWPLANGADEIEIDHFGVVLDAVVYSDPAWPDVSGESMSLDPDEYDATANDDADAWCGGQDAFGLGDLGTPGDVNPDCCPDADGDGYEDEACGGDDCDDTDSLIHPAATEVCNEVDDDCDDEIDEGLATTVWYPDGDGDGYGDANAAGTETCLVLADHVDNNGDCDDGDAAVNPGATEMCDAIDNDCDGEVDEDDAADALTFYEDADGDTYGNVLSSTRACSQPAGWVSNVLDCDDGDPNQYPGADELCNGEDDDCDGDVDEDDALDAQTWFEDGDGDGFGNAAVSDIDCVQPQGFVGNDLDCDDTDADQFPFADEYCNGEDDDCDGEVDEGDALDAQTWWADVDGDGFGDAAVEEVSCAAPQDFVGNPDDCDDGDSSQYPAADELCNGEDDDCDGDVDEDDALDALTWYEDLDGDGYGDPAVTAIACAAPADFVDIADDCDPTDGAQYPGADEVCNGEDDDCDGDVDEDAIDDQPWFIDNDGDGYGDSTVIEFACDQPPSFVDNDEDCDDADPDVNPAAEEVCNGIDDDCDHATDELVDGDGDTYSICDGDCDDMDVDVNPDAEEVCDGIDNDCDPATDEEVDGDGDGVTICGGDCDDTDPALFPGNPEICDGVDNDCDGALPDDEIDDDGDGMTECEGDCDDDDALTYTGAPEQCDQLDNDCDGEVDEDVDEDLDFDGFNACQGDCDNNDPNVYPFALEICDGKDDDCDGDLPLDELDEDLDGAMVCEGDCDDGDAALNLDDLDADAWTTCDGDCDDDDPATYPTAAELCDGIDNDCDGSLADDEVDADGDGYMACDDCDDDDPDAYPGDLDGDGYDACDDDCDDSDPDVNPGADELCDGIDNDCDGAIDDVDADGDGHPHEDCGGDDCDDEDAAVNPDEPEICDDGIDNDCDGDFDGFDAECEDEGDDDDDDDTTGGGCDCENNQAPGATASPVAALTALAFLVWIRRRTR